MKTAELPERASEYLLENVIQDTYKTLIDISHLMQRLSHESALNQEKPKLQRLHQQLQRQSQILATVMQFESLNGLSSVLYDAQLSDIEYKQKQQAAAIRSILSPDATAESIGAALSNLRLSPFVDQSVEQRYESILLETASSSRSQTQAASYSSDMMLQRQLEDYIFDPKSMQTNNAASYHLRLITDVKAVGMERGTLYLEKLDTGRLKYVGMGADGQPIRGLLNITVRGPLTEESLDSLKEIILDEIKQKGHDPKDQTFHAALASLSLMSAPTPNNSPSLSTLSRKNKQEQPMKLSFTEGSAANLPQRIEAYVDVVKEFLASSRLEHIDLPTCERKLALGQYLYDFIASQDSDFGRSLINEASRPELIALEDRVDALVIRSNSLRRDALSASSSSSAMVFSPSSSSSTSLADTSMVGSYTEDSIEASDLSMSSEPSASSVTQYVQPSVPVVPKPRLSEELRQARYDMKSQVSEHHRTPEQQRPQVVAVQPIHERPAGLLNRLVQGLVRPFRALRERIFPNDDRGFLPQAHQAPYRDIQPQPRASGSSGVGDRSVGQHPSPAANATAEHRDEDAPHIRLHR